MTDISLCNISKSFGDNVVFDNYSHTFPRGSCTCITGRSGCGKTTLLNIIMGLVTPDEGSVSGVPRHIAALFQEDRLCEDFTPVGNILAVTGNSVPVSEITDCLRSLGLSGSEDKPVSTLSGGMRRRVAIARALLAKSELVILDEPFKGLDDATRQNTANIILSRTAGKTLIVATHDPVILAPRCADSVVVTLGPRGV